MSHKSPNPPAIRSHPQQQIGERKSEFTPIHRSPVPPFHRSTAPSFHCTAKVSKIQRCCFNQSGIVSTCLRSLVRAGIQTLAHHLYPCQKTPPESTSSLAVGARVLSFSNAGSTELQVHVHSKHVSSFPSLTTDDPDMPIRIISVPRIYPAKTRSVHVGSTPDASIRQEEKVERKQKWKAERNKRKKNKPPPPINPFT